MRCFYRAAHDRKRNDTARTHHWRGKRGGSDPIWSRSKSASERAQVLRQHQPDRARRADLWHAWRALGERSARVVALLLVERTSKGHLKVIDLAAMLCSHAYLPCDSIHEVAMANRLVTERRDFAKPVRMSAEDDMLPDFVLRDAGVRTHIEVYGMNGVPAYEARKEEKRALRLARGIPAVEWDVDREPLTQVQIPPPSMRET
ncbi:DUF1173 family protein [Paraburkholderia sp. BR13439]|uniref:DUF1173 family protein n=1 Tax=unclassified Paraburkholderia TaxID=2615204 RepID=UPI0034CD0BD0